MVQNPQKFEVHELRTKQSCYLQTNPPHSTTRIFNKSTSTSINLQTTCYIPQNFGSPHSTLRLSVARSILGTAQPISRQRARRRWCRSFAWRDGVTGQASSGTKSSIFLLVSRVEHVGMNRTCIYIYIYAASPWTLGLLRFGEGKPRYHIYIYRYEFS